MRLQRRDIAFFKGLLAGLLIAGVLGAIAVYLVSQKALTKAAREIIPLYEVIEIPPVSYIVNLNDFDNPEEARWLAAEAGRAREAACRLLDCVDEPIGVYIIYHKERALVSLGGTRFDRLLPFPIVTVPDEVAGKIDRGFVVELRGATVEEAGKTLWHEMTHVVFWRDRFGQSRAPARGVDEANAILMDGELITRAFRSREYFGVDKILTSTTYPENKQEQSRLYDNASALLLYLLVEKGGLEPWRRFMAAAADGLRGFTEETFEEIYGVNFFQLKAEWRDWLNKNNPLEFDDWLVENYTGARSRFNELYPRLSVNQLSAAEAGELQNLITDRYQYQQLWQTYYQEEKQKWQERLDAVISQVLGAALDKIRDVFV